MKEIKLPIFTVGQRVRVKKTIHEGDTIINGGDTGIVVIMANSNTEIGVDFGHPFVGGHNFSDVCGKEQLCMDGCGFWFFLQELEKIEIKIDVDGNMI